MTKLIVTFHNFAHTPENGPSRSGAGVVDWIDLTQDRNKVAGACECGNGPQGILKNCG